MNIYTCESLNLSVETKNSIAEGIIDSLKDKLYYNHCITKSNLSLQHRGVL